MKLQIAFLLGAVFVVSAPGAESIGMFEAHADVGTNPKAGTAQFDPSTNSYQVIGGGANVWLKTDAFQFVYRKISGDFTFSADVRFVGTGTELHRKAMLMIRQNLDADSPYADVALHGDGLTALQYRPSAGVDTSEFRAAMKAPQHLSITRHGHEITISAGSPGDQPATTGPVIVSMQDPVYLGLAVCSHNANVLETAVFSNLKLETAKGAR